MFQFHKVNENLKTIHCSLNSTFATLFLLHNTEAEECQNSSARLKIYFKLRLRKEFQFLSILKMDRRAATNVVRDHCNLILASGTLIALHCGYMWIELDVGMNLWRYLYRHNSQQLISRTLQFKNISGHTWSWKKIANVQLQPKKLTFF